MREFVPDGTNFDDMMVKARESFRKYRIRANEAAATSAAKARTQARTQARN
jgi:hypothetical protein